jgi:hypothetical protein
MDGSGVAIVILVVAGLVIFFGVCFRLCDYIQQQVDEYQEMQ